MGRYRCCCAGWRTEKWFWWFIMMAMPFVTFIFVTMRIQLFYKSDPNWGILAWTQLRDIWYYFKTISSANFRVVFPFGGFYLFNPNRGKLIQPEPNWGVFVVFWLFEIISVGILLIIGHFPSNNVIPNVSSFREIFRLMVVWKFSVTPHALITPG